MKSKEKTRYKSLILLIPSFLPVNACYLLVSRPTIAALVSYLSFRTNPRLRSSPRKPGCNRPVKKHRRVPMLRKVRWQACFVFAVLAAFLDGSNLEAQNQQVAATLSGAITDP